MSVITSRLGAPLLLAAIAPLLLGAQRSAESMLAGEPPELAQRLQDQKVLVLEDVGGESAESFIVAYVVFERSRESVLSLLRQTERQAEYRTELDESKTIEHTPQGQIDEQRLRIMFTDFVYRLHYREDPETGRLEWKLDPDFDNDLARFEGFWDLMAYESEPNRTLARFGSNVDVGSMVPSFLQKGLSRNSVIRYLKNCRLWIDSNGEWRP